MSNTSTPGGIDDIAFHVLNPKVQLANPKRPKQRAEIHLDRQSHAKPRGRVLHGVADDSNSKPYRLPPAGRSHALATDRPLKAIV